MKQRLLFPLFLLVVLAGTAWASGASTPAAPAPPAAQTAISPPTLVSPAPGGKEALTPPAATPLCSGFFFVDCSRQCTDGSQQSAFGSGCTCDAAARNCTARLTCSGTTTIGVCQN